MGKLKYIGRGKYPIQNIGELIAVLDKNPDLLIYPRFASLHGTVSWHLFSTLKTDPHSCSCYSPLIRGSKASPTLHNILLALKPELTHQQLERLRVMLTWVLSIPYTPQT